MAFYKQDIVDINLNTGNIFRSFLNHSIGFKNDDADRFGIRVFRDGEPVDLTGASCQAVFMNPNGTNIALTSYGTVSGNVAYVTLPQACYDYEGQFCLSIQLVGGGVTGTMRIVDGMVVNTGASGAVAPTASVPTYQEILAVYAEMQEDIADYESVVANQNDQINSLKSAISFKTDVTPISWANGTFVNGSATTGASDRVRTGVQGRDPHVLYIDMYDGYQFNVLYWKSPAGGSSNYLGQTEFFTGSQWVYCPYENAQAYAVVIKEANGGNISKDNYAQMIKSINISLRSNHEVVEARDGKKSIKAKLDDMSLTDNYSIDYIKNAKVNITPKSWANGNVNNGSLTTNVPNRVRTGMTAANPHHLFVQIASGYEFSVYYYKSSAGGSSNYLGATKYIDANSYVICPYENAKAFVLLYRKKDDSNISKDDYASVISIYNVNVVDELTSLGFRSGGLDANGVYTSNVKRLVTKLLSYPYDIYVKPADAVTYQLSFSYFNDTDTTQLKSDNWSIDEKYIEAYTPFRIVVMKKDDTDISSLVSTADTLVTINKKATVTEPEYDFGVPAYYFANDYLPNKISQINTLIRGCVSDGDAFVFITDMHWDHKRNAQNSPKLLNYLLDKLNIPRIFNGGDNADGSNVAVPQLFRKVNNNTGSRTYYVPGNHEYIGTGSSEGNTDDDYAYAFNMFAGEEIVWGNYARSYYYVNNEKQKIRYIVLNGWTENMGAGFDNDQLSWFTNTALNAPSGWTIIIFTHAFYETMAPDYPNKLHYIYGAHQDVIEAYINAIDNYEGEAEIAAVFQGHTHLDRVIYTDNSHIPIIITTCDKCVRYEETDIPNVTRNAGTITEQAFDVVVLDKANKKLTLVRIGVQAKDGVGTDNVGDDVEYREVTYGNE